MRIYNSTLHVIFVAIALITGCSILKKEDPEKEVRLFIQEFKQSLEGSDQLVLSHFNARQSREAILAAIHVLQNKDMEYMTCTVNFDGAFITHPEEAMMVTIPVYFKSDGLDDQNEKESQVTLWIGRNEGKIVITRLGGEVLYDDYIKFKNSISWEVNKKQVEAERARYFAKAAELQQKYDSVIMYVNYKEKTYYYVVNGKWWNYFITHDWDNKPSDYRMGLVDETGKEIVPVEYSLIGTPGIINDDVVEVTKDGKIGYFEMNGNVLVPAEYDWIIPYASGSTMALVMKDTVEGWLNKASVFSPGLPDDEAAVFMRQFQFLPADLTITGKNNTMAEIPDQRYMGYGIIVPPSHWARYDLFPEIMGGFVRSDIENISDLESIQTKNSFIGKAFDDFSAFVTTITRRFLYGREEFYSDSRVTILGPDHKLILTQSLSSSDLSFRKIDSTLVELKSGSQLDYEFIDAGMEEMGIPQYYYFVIKPDSTVEALKSVRRFAFTEYVKMDSSYLQGKFVIYNEESGDLEELTFLSHKTLTRMRNEILAHYQFQFPDPAMAEEFRYYKWYTPAYKTYDDIVGGFTEVDQHNIAFLERMVGTLDPGHTAL